MCKRCKKVMIGIMFEIWISKDRLTQNQIDGKPVMHIFITVGILLIPPSRK